MKVRLVTAALAAAVPMSLMSVGTASAVWCPEDPPSMRASDCCGGKINDVWEKLFGGPLIVC